MMQEIITVSVLGALFLAVFGAAELLYKRGVAADTTRRLVHAGSGLLALSFPVVLTQTASVFLLCSSFLVILAVSKKYSWLGSIHKVERKSSGAVLFPVSVFLLFVLSRQAHDNALFYLPLAILAIADPTAAAVGRRFPIVPYALHPRAKKSLAGSAAFIAATVAVFVVAFGLVTTVAWLHSDWFARLHTQPMGTALSRCAVCALVATFGEALGHDGYDNLTIPAFAAGSMWLVGA